jgi:hypothetical protein
MRPIVHHRSSDTDLYLSRARGLLQRRLADQTPNGVQGTWFLLCQCSGFDRSLPDSLDLFRTQLFDVLRLFPTVPSSRRSRDRVRACSRFSYQDNNKTTTAILGVSTILAHGQSTSNVSNNGEITHLTGARYHYLPLEIFALAGGCNFHQEQSFSGNPLFGHKSSSNDPILAFFPKVQRRRAFFCDLFFFLPSSSRFRHHTNYIPISGHHSFSLNCHSHFIYLLLTATVSCHPGPSRVYLPSTLLSFRIITKRFYQISRTHLGPSHIFLGRVLRRPFTFRSVKIFFSSCFAATLAFFLALRKRRVQI